MRRYFIVWFQRKEAEAFLHLNGEQVIWSSKVKGAAEFSYGEALRMTKKFNDSAPLGLISC